MQTLPNSCIFPIKAPLSRIFFLKNSKVLSSWQTTRSWEVPTIATAIVTARAQSNSKPSARKECPTGGISHRNAKGTSKSSRSARMVTTSKGSVLAEKPDATLCNVFTLKSAISHIKSLRTRLFKSLLLWIVTIEILFCTCDLLRFAGKISFGTIKMHVQFVCHTSYNLPRLDVGCRSQDPLWEPKMKQEARHVISCNNFWHEKCTKNVKPTCENWKKNWSLNLTREIWHTTFFSTK